MKLLELLGITAISHHGALHVIAVWCPVHMAIATDGKGWRLVDGGGDAVGIRFALYRLKRQSVLIIGSISFRLDRSKTFS